MSSVYCEKCGIGAECVCAQKETMKAQSTSVMGSVPALICTVCLEAYEGEEGCTYLCDVCGRGGFCKDCARPQEHDCE